MKIRPSQFGMRENTASPGQHASRLAVSHSQSKSNGVSRNPRGDESSPHTPAAISVCKPSVIEAANAATGRTRTDKGHLLSVHDVADLLQVPTSWVYGHTRDRCPDRIPGFRLGKRSEEHTSELQSHHDLVCRLLLEKKKKERK